MTQPIQQTPPPKKSKKWPWVVGGAVTLLVFISIASNGSTDESTAADAPAPVAQPDSDPARPAVESPAPAASSAIPPLTAAPNTGKGKTIQYEIISDSGSLNSVTWFDENSAIQQEQNASAPWTLTVDNPSTFVIAGVGAQTTGTSVTCRVIVNGKVEDEQTATGQYAVVNCNAGL